LILQAEELGIGSCWIGWFNEKALKKEMKIPKDKKIDVVIALGYPAEMRGEARPDVGRSADDKVIPKARKSLGEISSFNVYDR
jgi:nitroreductase